ncbi:MAG: hypothetical protein WBP56_03045 [Polyangia bacterium]
MTEAGSGDAMIVVMDYGGVLGDDHQEPAERELASAIGVSRETCCALTSENSAQGAAFREDRVSEGQFWDWVFDLAGGDVQKRPPNEVLTRMWSETYAVNEGVLEILRAVRGRCPVGVLTNIDRGRSAYLVEKVGLLSEVDIYMPSYRYGAVKPKAELWEAANADIRRRFGKSARVLYIDDRGKHVGACAMIGWEGLLYVGVEALVRELIGRGLMGRDGEFAND